MDRRADGHAGPGRDTLDLAPDNSPLALNSLGNVPLGYRAMLHVLDRPGLHGLGRLDGFRVRGLFFCHVNRPARQKRGTGGGGS